MAGLSGPRSDSKQTLEIVITLLDVGVDVDRRVWVPDGASLGDLHGIIQAAMGWENCHLHEFRGRGRTIYGDASLGDDGWGRPRIVDESGVRVTEVLRRPGSMLSYEYDFGDSWLHHIELVAVHADAGSGTNGPACIDGRGACPPEDCGGPWGYREVCEMANNPEARQEREEDEESGPYYDDDAEYDDDEDGEDDLPWWAEKWDPAAFDLASANHALSRVIISGVARPRA